MAWTTAAYEPNDVLARHPYLQDAGTLYWDALGPYDIALVHDYALFEAEVLTERENGQSSLEIERIYLRIFNDVLFDTYEEYALRIEDQSDLYVASKLSLKKINQANSYPKWKNIESTLERIEEQFNNSYDEIAKMRLSNTPDTWSRHHRALIAAVKRTRDLAQEMAKCIDEASQTKDKRKEGRIARAGVWIGVFATFIAGAQFTFDFNKKEGGEPSPPPPAVTRTLDPADPAAAGAKSDPVAAPNAVKETPPTTKELPAKDNIANPSGPE